MAALVHEVLQIDDLRIALTAAVVVECLQLVLTQIVADNADAGVGVDDGSMLSHNLVVEEEMQAETVHIAHEEAFGIVGKDSWQALLNAFLHAACGTVGEGEAGHLAEGHTMLVGPHDALGQHGGLAAARRRQYEVMAASSFDDTLLLSVELHFHVFLTHLLAIYYLWQAIKMLLCAFR